MVLSQVYHHNRFVSRKDVLLVYPIREISEVLNIDLMIPFPVVLSFTIA